LRGCWAFPEVGAIYVHRRAPNSSTPDALRKYFCTPSAKTSPINPCESDSNSPDRNVYEYVAARSQHPGGVNCLFGDGHVEFYGNSVAPDVWRSLGSIKGGGPPLSEGFTNYQ
jgi:prepilin-type processing-associated H-X9-DG protein